MHFTGHSSRRSPLRVLARESWCLFSIGIHWGLHTARVQSKRHSEQREQGTGQPDREQFRLQNNHSARREKRRADRRNFDPFGRKKVAASRKRREEPDAEPAICKGVQKTVRDRGEGEKKKRSPGTFASHFRAEPKGERRKNREGNRVTKSPMSEHCLVRDSELESQHIQIRQNRTQDTKLQEARGNDAATQGDANRERNGGMRNDGGDWLIDD